MEFGRPTQDLCMEVGFLRPKLCPAEVGGSEAVACNGTTAPGFAAIKEVLACILLGDHGDTSMWAAQVEVATCAS